MSQAVSARTLLLPNIVARRQTLRDAFTNGTGLTTFKETKLYKTVGTPHVKNIGMSHMSYELVKPGHHGLQLPQLTHPSGLLIEHASTSSTEAAGAAFPEDTPVSDFLEASISAGDKVNLMASVDGLVRK